MLAQLVHDTPFGVFLLAVAASAFVGSGIETWPAQAGKQQKGEILFSDDFNRGTLGRWRVSDPQFWSVRGGVARAHLPDEKQKRSFLFAGSNAWKDYSVSVRVRGLRGIDKGVVVRVAGEEGVGVDLRGGDKQDLVVYRGRSKLGEAAVPNRNGKWYRIRIDALGHTYRIYVDGRHRLTVEDEAGEQPSGGMALGAYTGGVGQCTVEYDQVVARSLSHSTATNESPETGPLAASPQD